MSTLEVDRSELRRSTVLHQAVARYNVGIPRMVPVKRDEAVASQLTWSQAKQLQAKVQERLTAEEPEWAGCMCRSLATIAMSNKTEVAQVLGYGPGYCYDKAVNAAERFLEQERQRSDLTVAEAEGLREVTAAFVEACR